MTGNETWDALEARVLERQAEAARVAAEIENGKRFQHPDGDRMAIVHRDTYPDTLGQWRISRFYRSPWKTGWTATGHDLYETLEAAVYEALLGNMRPAP